MTRMAHHGRPAHREAQDYLLDLLLDLKLQILGRPPHHAITRERVAEGLRHYDELNRCRVPHPTWCMDRRGEQP